MSGTLWASVWMLIITSFGLISIYVWPWMWLFTAIALVAFCLWWVTGGAEGTS